MGNKGTFTDQTGAASRWPVHWRRFCDAKREPPSAPCRWPLSGFWQSSAGKMQVRPFNHILQHFPCTHGGEGAETVTAGQSSNDTLLHHHRAKTRGHTLTFMTYGRVCALRRPELIKQRRHPFLQPAAVRGEKGPASEEPPVPKRPITASSCKYCLLLFSSVYSVLPAMDPWIKTSLIIFTSTVFSVILKRLRHTHLSLNLVNGEKCLSPPAG